VKKSSKRNILISVVIIIAIQFWPIDRTNPPVTSEVPAPENVKAVLRAACYNCHSNETKWPWYSYVAPVSWMIADDVHSARSHVNLSEWESIPPRDRPAVADHMWKLVREGEMPLLMYRWMHPEARLSEDQKALIRDWAGSVPQ
jgi:hypothetical protein